ALSPALADVPDELNHLLVAQGNTGKQSHSARLLNVLPRCGLGRQEFRILFVPKVVARTVRAELPHEWARRTGKLPGIGVEPHEHVMAWEPATGDDLRHRSSPPSCLIKCSLITSVVRQGSAPPGVDRPLLQCWSMSFCEDRCPSRIVVR